ncbi:uncharacterized protein LOC135120004 [Zophobas morio]|uniref:uncharacterized protein LOC135120004 n=1 Tax=Zophobas morio TaxID=2755281 RepID=UPI003082A954
MEKKKLNQKKRSKSKKPGFLKNFFMCILKNDEEEDTNPRNQTNVSFKPSKIMPAKREVSVTFSTTSSYYLMQPVLAKLENMSPNNALLSQAYSEKFESSSIEQEETLPPKPEELRKEVEKEQKDQLVRSILSKYLQMKREDMLNKIPETENENQESMNSPQSQKGDFLNVDCFASDSSDTILLENAVSNQELDIKNQRPKTEFPTKSRSAPTNSTAHDSLADICFKMSRYKQQENKSDSYVTCCSEETTKDNATTSKKKLELIFNPSSEENSSCLEDNSSFSLQYEISCERTPVATGILRADSVLQHNGNEKTYNFVTKHSRGTKIASPELYLNPPPYVKGEIDGLNGSSSSLKWKLIISHHGRGDFR